MNNGEFCKRLEIETTILEVWIERRWLVPQQTSGRPEFDEAELARARLIQDLVGPMGVNDDGVDVAMQLLDQVHGLRGRLNRLVEAVRRQDAEVQKRILALLDADD
ncbi:chaperone modulatory protein CbpM [Pararhizobium capsulatum DSM 1112]|uniref:Chaperone modulatory protein CbpM n=1 Tax=Pararhizobium capsulatum DSM 1112 TaxID=1121113 RepID=A0ABU0BUM6_9HYPH|nr:chaperone modulator CbpM [Pararhizobium capsulatum]MDQ0320542.1 chaperone modulatory protein CbpM [Pararhizobium capsulatum DSM 1112]